MDKRPVAFKVRNGGQLYLIAFSVPTTRIRGYVVVDDGDVTWHGSAEWGGAVLNSVGRGSIFDIEREQITRRIQAAVISASTSPEEKKTPMQFTALWQGGNQLGFKAVVHPGSEVGLLFSTNTSGRVWSQLRSAAWRHNELRGADESVPLNVLVSLSSLLKKDVEEFERSGAAITVDFDNCGSNRHRVQINNLAVSDPRTYAEVTALTTALRNPFSPALPDVRKEAFAILRKYLTEGEGVFK